MNKEETEVMQSVSDTITEKPVVFDVTYTDFFKKSRKKSFEIKPLVLGTLVRISTLFLSMDIDQSKGLGYAYTMMKDHSRKVAEIVALAVSNSKQEPSKKLIDFFFYNLTVNELATLLVIVLKQANVMNFIITITSIKNLNVLSSESKKEVSPQSQRS